MHIIKLRFICLLLLAGVLCVILIAPLPRAQAGNITLTPSLKETFEYDTNPLLSEQNQKALYGLVTEPDLIVLDATPDQTVSLDTRFDISKFNLPNYSSSDVHSVFQARQTELNGFVQLNSYFDYDTTRTSELIGSGFNSAGIRHTNVYVSPMAGLQLFSSDLFTVEAGYRSESYESPRYTNYETFDVVPTLRHSLNEDNSILTTIQASHFETTSGSPGTTDALGPGIGWNHQFSQIFFGQAVGGYYFIKYTQDSIHSTTQDYFFNLNLSYTGLSDTISMILARDLSPEATTLQITSTSLTFQERHSFTRRFSGTLNVLYRDEAVSVYSPGQQTNYIEANANFKYYFTDILSLSAGYRFRQQKLLGEQGRQTSNAILVSLILSPHHLFLNN